VPPSAIRCLPSSHPTQIESLHSLPAADPRGQLGSNHGSVAALGPVTRAAQHKGTSALDACRRKNRTLAGSASGFDACSLGGISDRFNPLWAAIVAMERLVDKVSW
jgi:hypothetical protein